MFDTKTIDEREYMNATKNLTMRMRLNRDIQFNKGFSDKHLIKAEYGNYEKYEKNSIEHEVDELDNMEGDHFVGNFRKFHRKLPTADAEARRDQEE